MDYIGFGDETLKRLPRAKAGDLVLCRRCGGHHPLEEKASREGTFSLGFYRCGDELYLASVDGRLVAYTRPDVSGRTDDPGG